jgi:hypothetical protein
LKKLFFALNVLMIFLPVHASAKEPLQISVHGVPPKFFEYLWRHDAEANKFDQGGAWVSDQDADIIVIVLSSLEDEHFIPPNFQTEYTNALALSGAPFVRVQAGYYDGSTDRAVIFVAMDSLNEKLDRKQLAPPPDSASRPGYVTCFTAGWVNRQYSPAEKRKNYDELSRICHSWVGLGQ